MGLNVAQKIIKAHLVDGQMKIGEEIAIRIDQVLIQDLTGTQAFLHFESMGLRRVRAQRAVCYADHNVIQVKSENMQDHLYLQSASKKYGCWFAKPGAGIGHQIHLEHFAVPGATALGADSHTPHCGGVGMLAIGAGGLDVAVAMGGGAYHFKMPQIVGVHMSGALPAWSTAKDVILMLLGKLTVRGGFEKIFEFGGPGIKTLNAQERVTITNMGTELGATTSLFPSDEVTRDYFQRLGRPADWREVLPDSDAKYDDVIELNLSGIEPMVALPSLPDRVHTVREVAGEKIEQVLIGSCTNGSYTDLQAVARIVRGRRVHPDVNFIIHPSSRADLEHLAEKGMLADLIAAGVNVAEATCGACIGTGHVPAPGTKSVRAVNRNFRGRSGLKDDAVYLTSSETAAATALKGVLTDPRDLDLPAPTPDLPDRIAQDNVSLIAPVSEAEASGVEVIRGANIVPAPPKEPLQKKLQGEVLIKVEDDISTDHILPAASEVLAYRSNIPKISEFVFYRLDPSFSQRAGDNHGGFIVGGENYGQGSSREHAALAPMFLGIKGVIAKSFARIHHSNLINFGLLPLVFKNPDDYDRIAPGDRLEIEDAIGGVQHRRIIVKDLTRGFNFETELAVTERHQKLLLAGGLLAYTRQHGLDSGGR